MGGDPDQDQDVLTTPIETGEAGGSQSQTVADQVIKQPETLPAALTDMGSPSPAADTPEGFDLPLLTRDEPKSRPHGISGASQEMAQRERAKEEYRRVADRALREANNRLDLLRYHHVNEQMREFGIPQEASRRSSRILDDNLNEQEYNATSVPRRLLNAAKGGLLKWGQGWAITNLKALDRMDRENAEIQAQGDRGEFLPRWQAFRYENMQVARENMNQARAQALMLALDAQQQLDQMPDNPTGRRMDAALTEKEAFKIFFEDPWMILGEGVAESAPTVALGLGATALTGPILGGVFTGVVKFDSTFRSKVIENLANEGIDLRNSAALLKATQDQDLMRRIFGDAWWHAVATTGTDMMTGPLTSKVRIPIKRPGLSQVVNTPVKAGLEGGMAVAGEAGSAAIRGKELQPGDTVRSFAQGAAGSFVGNAGENVRARLAALPATIRTARIEAQERDRFSSNRYVEPQTLQADTAATLAERAVAVGRKIRSWEILKSSRDPDQYIKQELGENLKGYIAPADLKVMIDKGYFVQDGIANLKLREKIAAAEAAGRDVEISMRDLIKGNNIMPKKRSDVMHSLRFEADGPTGHEARGYIERENARLDSIVDRYDVSHPTRVEGGFTFQKIVADLIWDGFSRGEALRQAARRIEVYEERARAMSTPERRETADTVYWRDHYRKLRELPLNPRPNEDRRLEDQTVANQLRRLGIATP